MRGAPSRSPAHGIIAVQRPLEVQRKQQQQQQQQQQH